MPQSIKTDLKQWIFNENAQYSGAGEKHLISAEDNVWGRCIGMRCQLVQPVPGNRRGGSEKPFGTPIAWTSTLLVNPACMVNNFETW